MNVKYSIALYRKMLIIAIASASVRLIQDFLIIKHNQNIFLLDCLFMVVLGGLYIKSVIKPCYISCVKTFLIFINASLTIYILANHISIYHGLLLFFLPFALIPYVLLHDERIREIKFFMAFAIVCFLISACFSVLREPAVNGYSVYIFYLALNFTLVLLFTVYSFKYLIDVKIRSEEKLKNIVDENVKKNQNLQKLNIELDEFLYRTSHDLRSPILSIKGLLNLAEKDSTFNYVSVIKERLESLDGLLLDIRNFLINRNSKINSRLYNLNALIRKTVSDILSKSDRSVQFIEEFESEVNVLIDSERLKIVVYQLVSNAILHHDNGKLHKWVKLSLKEMESDIVFTISDNGKGISGHHLGKIFNMFYRANDESYGSGLGLYIVKEIIEKLKGTIHVSSQLGIGTTFEITIPKAMEVPTEEVAPVRESVFIQQYEPVFA